MSRPNGTPQVASAPGAQQGCTCGASGTKPTTPAGQPPVGMQPHPGMMGSRGLLTSYPQSFGAGSMQIPPRPTGNQMPTLFGQPTGNNQLAEMVRGIFA